MKAKPQNHTTESPSPATSQTSGTGSLTNFSLKKYDEMLLKVALANA
jgi:hypothetical protein